MKLSDYLAAFLAEKGIDTIFGYQGSSISHTIDSISRQEGLQFVETRHEQAAAFAANGYALVRNKPGVALSCSGPGALNLLSGVADAYYDSIPCLFITGQVSVHEMKTRQEMRQLGFQETDIVSIAKPITKYAVMIKEPSRIAYELEKAMYLMTEGRPGPVLIDIPHNVQGSSILPDELVHYSPPSTVKEDPIDLVRLVSELLTSSIRPVILLGGGSRELRMTPALLAFLETLNVPIVASYRGKDVIDNNSAVFIGTLGVYGQRAANLVVKHCDLLISLGSRLDGRQTGGNYNHFADNAKVVVVDIDQVELHDKPETYVKIHNSTREFLLDLQSMIPYGQKDGEWLTVAKRWKQRYPSHSEYSAVDGVNPHQLLERISSHAAPDAVFATDVGQNQVWTNSSLQIGREAVLIQSCGLGSMGFSLPAAIGGYFARKAQTICICGDGGFQMNSQELQTISHYRIPLKIFVFNNRSLGLIRIYQEKALGGRLFGSVEGFDSPDYETLAKAYGLAYARIENDLCECVLVDVIHSPEAYLVEVCISSNSTCFPEPTYQSTVENQTPVLSEAEKEIIRKEALFINE